MTQPIPASKQLASHCRSGRGACGFVLVGNSEVTPIETSRRTTADSSAPLCSGRNDSLVKGRVVDWSEWRAIRKLRFGKRRSP